MPNHADGPIATESVYSIRTLKLIVIVTALVFLPDGMLGAETRWTPFVNLSAAYDDNILLTETNTEDDYIYLLQPGLKLDYDQELSYISTEAGILFRKYQDNDDLDDQVYRFNLNGNTNLTERFRLQGGYEFIKDTTLDSELLETGRISSREDRLRNNAILAPEFNLTERTSIGFSVRYNNVAYDSDTKVDYSVWDLELPIRRLLATQIDTVSIIPGYTYRDSDINRSDTYSFRVGWDHETSERLILHLTAGVRYTEHERLATGETEDDWSGVGSLRFNYIFENGGLIVDFQRDLRNTANGDQAEVSRVMVSLKLNFSERMGMDLNGRYYYTETEGEADDETTDYVQAGPEFFYQLTENHVLYINYLYSQETQRDIEGEPSIERNRVQAGVRLNFPMY